MIERCSRVSVGEQQQQQEGNGASSALLALAELHVQQTSIVNALRHELSEYTRRLALIHEQLDVLRGWLRGECQLHAQTAAAGEAQIQTNALLGGRLAAILEALAGDRVPSEWRWLDAAAEADAENAKATSAEANANVTDWLQSLAQSCSFFEIWLSLIVYWQLNQSVSPGLSIAGATHSQLHLVSLPLPNVYLLPAFHNPLRLLRCFSSPSSASLTFDVNVDSRTPKPTSESQPQTSESQPQTSQSQPELRSERASRLSVIDLINLAFVHSIPNGASPRVPAVAPARGLSVFGVRVAGLSGTGLQFSDGRLGQSDSGTETGASGTTSALPLPPLRLELSSGAADSQTDARSDKSTAAAGGPMPVHKLTCPLRARTSEPIAELLIPIVANPPPLAAIHVLC